MSKTVYVVKTPSGYMAPPEMLQAWVRKSEDARQFTDPDLAAGYAVRYGGKVETLTLDSPSHGS